MISQRVELLIGLEKLRIGRWNCNSMSRQDFEALKQGMKRNGPDNTPAILVRPLPAADNVNFEIINGVQRFRAAEELGWKGLYALVKETSDDDAKYLCLALNFPRRRIDPLKLLDLLYEEWEDGNGWLSITMLEQKYHGLFNQRYIQRVLGLRTISQEARDLIENYRSSDKVQEDFQITLSHLHVLSKLKHPKDQLMYCKVMVEMRLSPDELDVQVKNRVEELNEWEKTREIEMGGEVEFSGHKANQDQQQTEKRRRMGSQEFVEPPLPLSPKQKPKPKPKKVEEEIFVCPSCNSRFLVNYSSKRVLSLEDKGTYWKATQLDGMPSEMKEACPACGGTTAPIDNLERETQRTIKEA